MLDGTLDDELLVFGGCASDVAGPCFDELWRLDMRCVSTISSHMYSSFSWSEGRTAGDVPSARGYMAGGMQGGVLYAAMGWSATAGIKDDVFMLDVDQLTWRLCTCAPREGEGRTVSAGHSVYSPSTPHARLLASSSMLGGARLVVGGGCVK